MNELDWSHFDDELFVQLAADLLRSRGYTVKYQGDGPDGGIDLFASQPMQFGFDDPRPFKWAVQCKFSRSTRRAVNDAEIKDVEGVLRSSRYQVEKPKGYLVITNRRISQNVVERLRGVNDQTEFRTCALDGTRLSLLLQSNDSLFRRYFSSLKTLIASHGRGIILPWLPSPDVKRPSIPVKISSPDLKYAAPSIEAVALMDTGSDLSIVSPGVIQATSLPVINRREIATVGGTLECDVCSANLALMKVTKLVVEVVVLETGFDCVLGQNVLSQLTFLWDGPNEAVQVWPVVAS